MHILAALTSASMEEEGGQVQFKLVYSKLPLVETVDRHHIINASIAV